MSARFHRGFSFLEVLISVVVLTIGLLGVMGSLTFGLRASAYSGTTSEAVNCARQILERIRLQNLAWSDNVIPPDTVGLADTASDRRAIEAPPFQAMTPSRNLRRNIQMHRVSMVASDPNYNLMQVQVTIYWFDRGSEKSVALCAFQRRP